MVKLAGVTLAAALAVGTQAFPMDDLKLGENPLDLKFDFFAKEEKDGRDKKPEPFNCEEFLLSEEFENGFTVEPSIKADCEDQMFQSGTVSGCNNDMDEFVFGETRRMFARYELGGVSSGENVTFGNCLVDISLAPRIDESAIIPTNLWFEFFNSDVKISGASAAAMPVPEQWHFEISHSGQSVRFTADECTLGDIPGGSGFQILVDSKSLGDTIFPTQNQALVRASTNFLFDCGLSGEDTQDFRLIFP
uniref:Uncharacterized protein n=1 Tax=Chromera velia CCMP2878 TaxID=1169474 RepID=A0A0G4GH71_9ALVE|eukprot:Cvel_21887.t1-p1 / transcript=Cvel_21887.t1 / gene=Cvel_21887 / organism=Chromera_velia_CCMP2878 / gene_product=hypothetical protein / transcript_product=hypothetical protein / location=Cvel_scaffold2093:26572-27587(+) / protein_length=248 / sequence_SO=supercontig / SO=protein_coding / is_pseudo=false